MTSDGNTSTAQPATTEQLFWARELVQLAKSEAKKRNVPDHAMAQAMMVNAWMLFTGQNEEEARKAVSAMFSASMAKRVAAAPTPPAN